MTNRGLQALVVSAGLLLGLLVMGCAASAYVAPKQDNGGAGPGGANRTDCSQIFNTAYHSDDERKWFEANCSKWPATNFADVAVTRGPEPAQCAQIRGRPYENDQQRRFYLDNCNTTPIVPTPGSGPDRTDCNAIRGSGYRSNNERNWYLSNCVQPAVQDNQLQQLFPGLGATPRPPANQPTVQPTQAPDRYDCNLIRNGQPFRSNNERAWFQQYCR